VFGLPDPRWGQVVAAALAFVPGSEPNLDELQALLAANLASHERPRLVALLAELPLNAGGKIDRERVKETARARLLILQR
jgi:acyl-CoA synthetase (AMP-forming)/AMP-acid ligase II